MRFIRFHEIMQRSLTRLNEHWLEWRNARNRGLHLHARALVDALFPHGYDGEFFVAGGAFKPWLRQGAQIQDYDVFVRGEPERVRLESALRAQGAVPNGDYPPFYRGYKVGLLIIEIPYHNVATASLKDLLDLFDLNISRIGLHWTGKVLDVVATADCRSARRFRRVAFSSGCRIRLTEGLQASPLGSLHRLVHQGTRLGFDYNCSDEDWFWECFVQHYSPHAQQLAVDLYQRIHGAIKHELDLAILDRAQQVIASGKNLC